MNFAVTRVRDAIVFSPRERFLPSPLHALASYAREAGAPDDVLCRFLLDLGGTIPLLYDPFPLTPSEEEFDLLSAHGIVIEVLDGVPTWRTMPSSSHQEVIGRLYRLVGARHSYDEEGGWFFVADPDLVRGADRYRPDLAGWRLNLLTWWPASSVKERDERIKRTPPHWVLEVLSASREHHDLDTKLGFYATLQVADYWIVDRGVRQPDVNALMCWTLQEGAYQNVIQAPPPQRIHASPFPDLEIDLDRLFRFS